MQHGIQDHPFLFDEFGGAKRFVFKRLQLFVVARERFVFGTTNG